MRKHPLTTSMKRKLNMFNSTKKETIMKLVLLTATALTIGFGSAQAGVSDYTPEQIKEMPRFASIENVRCPSARYPSVKKRLECKKEVRVELFEKRKARDNAQEG